jgi:type 1 glutamine amidotransferase
MRVLAITGGHRVDHDAFRQMLAAICDERGWVFAHAVQPEAQRWLTPEHRGAFDAILCHDIPGLALARGTEPAPVGPDQQTAEALRAVLDAGQGLVVLHHALAGWPGWPGWAEVLGGRYHYAPGELRGQAVPDSGFRYAHYTASPQEHPVTDGVPAFDLDDELYCCPVFEDDVVALLRATDVEPGDFHETYREVLGTRGPTTPLWQHPPASDLIGWAKAAGRSPLVYLQPGDGPATFANPHFRHLLANALAWVASPDAHEWAAQHRTRVTTSDITTSDITVSDITV